jgi:hypothetical protein
MVPDLWETVWAYSTSYSVLPTPYYSLLRTILCLANFENGATLYIVTQMDLNVLSALYNIYTSL